MFVAFVQDATGDTYNCNVTITSYAAPKGRTAILLADAEDGSPVATATLNPAPHIVLAANEVCIKDYSENAGMLESLIAWGIILAPHRFIESGYEMVPVCYLASMTVLEGCEDCGLTQVHGVHENDTHCAACAYVNYLESREGDVI